MSFALTTDQVRNRTKTVTRRTGWRTLEPGTLLCAVRKGMGLKKGETVERLAVIRVTGVRREPLAMMIRDPDYGLEECRREGFPDGLLGSPDRFVSWFSATHRCEIADDLTRIEFEYAAEATVSTTLLQRAQSIWGIHTVLPYDSYSMGVKAHPHSHGACTFCGGAPSWLIAHASADYRPDARRISCADHADETIASIVRFYGGET